MKPTIGRIVLYTTDALDQRMINEHPLNTPQVISPAIIVAVVEDTVNLKVLIDGTGELYKKGVIEGDEPGQWKWPVIESLTLEDETVDLDFTDDSELKLGNSFATVDALLSGYLATEAAGQPTQTETSTESTETESVTPLVIQDEAAGQTSQTETTESTETESATPLVILDEATGKHKAVAKKKIVEKNGVVDFADESK